MNSAFGRPIVLAAVLVCAVLQITLGRGHLAVVLAGAVALVLSGWTMPLVWRHLRPAVIAHAPAGRGPTAARTGARPDRPGCAAAGVPALGRRGGRRLGGPDPVMPEVTCQGRTSYGEAFDLVRQCIDRDLPTLKAQGLATLRPAVFFITDGAPTDPAWEAAFARLVDRSWPRHPHVIAYGCGEAVEAVLARIGAKAAFTADGGTGQEEALAAAISSLVNSLVASARAEELRIPEQVPGYRSVKQEYVD
jgi:hypothetical protein